MKTNIPPLNVFVSSIYITGIIALIYVLKLSLRKTKALSPKRQYQKQSSKDIDVNFNKRMAVSWLKKYSVIGAFINEDKKYLLKQFLIMSSYAIICLRINRIIIWPVSLITCLLPISFLLFEILIDKITKLIQSATASAHNNVQGQIEQRHPTNLLINANNIIENEVMAGIKTASKAKDPLFIKKDRSFSQVLIITSMGLVAAILYYQTVVTLTRSVSNSGQLNIVSVLIILCIDQCLIRPVSGLTLFSVLKILLHYQLINQQNLMIQSLCREEIMINMIEVERQKQLNKKQELTTSPFKIQMQFKVSQRHNQEIGNHCLDLFFIENQEQSQNKIADQAKLDQEKSVQLDEDLVFLTTAQRQLFGKQQSEQTFRQRNILNEITNRQDKQNTDVQNLQKSTLVSQQFTKEAITIRQQTLNDKVLHINDFSLENSLVKKRQSKKGPGKKGAKRQLTITGSSPYLQYLPNMLKNVDKYRQYSKDITQPTKML